MNLIGKYRWTLVSLFCVALNIPFAMTGHVVNIFALGWCSAAVISSFVNER